jgi:hypothetical protein
MPIGAINEETIRLARRVGIEGTGILRTRMDSVGDGSGTKEMAAAADVYYTLPASSEVYVIDRIQIIMKDDGSMPWEEFAATAGVIANGLRFKVIRQTASGDHDVTDLLDNEPIIDNAGFFRLGIVSRSLSGGAGQSILSCQISFPDLIGYPIRLDGEFGDGLMFEVRDDLSGLQSFEVWVNGATGH